MIQRSPMRRSVNPMKQIGKRGRAWNAARAKVKAGCVLAGITRCEFGYEHCVSDDQLWFAHACKRRELSRKAERGTPEHIETAAVACWPCHRKLDEEMTHSQMRKAVMTAIAKRI